MTSIPGLRRPAQTWTFLVDLVRATTEPRANADWCDEQVTELAADSAIARAMFRVADPWRRAADHSGVIAACRRLASARVPRRLADRVRCAGVVAAIAAATTLVLRTATTERDPLTWALPAAVGVISVVAAAAAGPVARAIANDRT